MGWIALAVMASMNLLTAWSYWRRGDHPMTLVFTCYGISVLGFLWQYLAANK